MISRNCDATPLVHSGEELSGLRRRNRLLTAEEERMLATAAGAGCTASRARLIESNLGLVIAVARRYAGHGLPLSDLIGEGNLALVRAADCFDPGRQVRFATYAALLIQRAIHEAIARARGPFAVPRGMRKHLARWQSAAGLHFATRGCFPDDSALARDLGLAPANAALVSRTVEAVRRSGTGQIRSDDRLGRLEEQIAASDEQPPDAAVAADERLDALRSAIEELTEQEQAVVRAHFGLQGAPPMTLREIARVMRLSLHRVRRLRDRALLGLREALRPAARVGGLELELEMAA